MIWLLAIAYAQSMSIAVTVDLCRPTVTDPTPACLIATCLPLGDGCVLTPPSAAVDGWTCTVDGDGCRLTTLSAGEGSPPLAPPAGEGP